MAVDRMFMKSFSGVIISNIILTFAVESCAEIYLEFDHVFPGETEQLERNATDRNRTIYTILDSLSSNVASDNVTSGSAGSRNNWQVFFLFIIAVAGITGNVLVCLAVSVEKKLQTVTNYFLLSLAVADLFVSLIVMPCCILQEYMGEHIHSLLSGDNAGVM